MGLKAVNAKPAVEITKEDEPAKSPNPWGIIAAILVGLLLLFMYIGRGEYLKDPTKPKWNHDDRPIGRTMGRDTY